MKFDPLTGNVATATYAYDEETGILGAKIGETETGAPGTVELSDYGGGIVLLHTSGGVIHGIEIVVWPDIAPAQELNVPVPTQTGSVTYPESSAEIECDVVCRVNEDGSMLHLAIEDGFATHTIKIADKILVDLDDDYELVGLWLLELPGGISVAV